MSREAIPDFDAPIFQINPDPPKPPWPEGYLVFHEQLGPGFVLRPEKWDCSVSDLKIIGNACYVAFMGHAPVVIIECNSLQPLIINWFKWVELWPIRPQMQEGFTCRDITGFKHLFKDAEFMVKEKSDNACNG